jgi:transposase
VARHCGLKHKLGVKGKTGVLASKLTRAAFLCQPEHRVTFHFTPRHASWLNQVEIWFSILVRKLLRRDNFASKKALRTKSKSSSPTSTKPWPSLSVGPTRVNLSPEPPERQNESLRAVPD